jgi:uncharacterized protein
VPGENASVIEYEGDKSKVRSGAGTGETFAEVLRRRLSRRDVFRGTLATSGLVLGATDLRKAVAQSTPAASPAASPVAGGATGFAGIAQNANGTLTVAEGYTAVPFLQWGDPLFPDSPAFDAANVTAAAQERQFGYNCDWIGYIPFDEATASTRGLLAINHEYTNPELMFPGYLTPNPEYVEGSEEIPENLVNTSQAIVDAELAAHGLTIVEVAKGEDGAWSVALDSQYNRRITGTTACELTGPAAGNALVQTTSDATGTSVIGMLNNCAGGTTPWGTIVSGEENFNQYFGNFAAIAEDAPVYAIHDRIGFEDGASERLWETIYDRFDLGKEPNEPNRFGWAVEIDPFDPEWTPRKRTALGRNKHEGHTSVVAPTGQVVFYSGDDERFDYAYKFVTAGSFNPDDRAANRDLLDEGTLYVARFNDDGTGEWLPLVFGEGPLTAENGFESQGDVLIKTRLAADLLGPTKMDRPEDFETNPVSGMVYLVLTNNSNRGVEDNPAADASNPRNENEHGHIIEITEADGNHAATMFTWELFMVCGDPADESTYYAGFAKDQVSSISRPDNITFDNAGNLWIATDGQPSSLEFNDGIFAVPTEGVDRGNLKLFFTGVPGGEVSGPIFTPDNTALFASIQHPGEGGTYEDPLTSWPGESGPPRPSVVLITRIDGGLVGS